MSKTAIVIGVGAGEGLGAPRSADMAGREGLHVFIGGRTERENRRGCRRRSARMGGQATAVVADTTEAASVAAFVEAAEQTGPIDLAVFNAGNNMPGDFLEMDADYFETCWRIGCYGGFLFCRESLRRMVPRGAGTLLLTGASASMRGKPNFAAFTSAKAGLRALGQSLARDYGPQGIHVAHVVVDGGVDGERIKTRAPDFAKRVGEDGLIGLDGLAETYRFLYRQQRNAWSQEVDLRTHKEAF